MRWRAGGLIVLLACGACDSGDEEPDAPSFVEIRERVLMPSCAFAACHSGAAPAGMLGLDSEDAHANLLSDSPTTSRARVVVGDADGSYLFEKLTAETPETGDQMPPTAPLEADRIELVRAWIDDGAPRD